MTADPLPTPDLLVGGCVHGRTTTLQTGSYPAQAIECRDCIALALSRARDEGIEAAAKAAEEILLERCVCGEQRARVAAAIRALKEDRWR